MSTEQDGNSAGSGEGGPSNDIPVEFLESQIQRGLRQFQNGDFLWTVD